jgi:hypothetical protein
LRVKNYSDAAAIEALGTYYKPFDSPAAVSDSPVGDVGGRLEWPAKLA